MLGKIVVVTWMDTEDKLDWETLSEVKKYTCPIIHSVGWFIEETADHVKICMHDSEGKDIDDREISTVSTIPKGMVKNIKTVYNKRVNKCKE